MRAGPQLPLLQMVLTLVYVPGRSGALARADLGWLLLVSGWARRAPFLWAVLPPLALCVIEKIAFDSNRFGAFLAYRLEVLHQAFAEQPRGAFALPEPDPAAFLSNPDLWTGLAVAAAFLAAAVWVRRYREPI